MQHTFSYMIFYVPDVKETIAFFKKAFGIDSRFVHESGDYAELDTGQTALAFATPELVAKKFEKPQGCEVCLTTEDVDRSFQKAIQMGASEVEKPIDKPWGQRVAYVADPNGILIAIGSETWKQ